MPEENQTRYQMLCDYPDAEAAKLLKVTKQRAWQLRKELQVPVSSQEARARWNTRLGAKYYQDIASSACDFGSKTREWRLARAYARSVSALWPPPKSGTRGQLVYDYAVENPALTWEDLNKVFGIKNSCSFAAEYARRSSSPWPLKGGQGAGPRGYSQARLLHMVDQDSVMDALCDLVIDLKTDEACVVNSQGANEQLSYVLEQLSPQEVAKELGLND
jgi:hypothetical protein